MLGGQCVCVCVCNTHIAHAVHTIQHRACELNSRFLTQHTTRRFRRWPGEGSGGRAIYLGRFRFENNVSPTVDLCIYFFFIIIGWILINAVSSTNEQMKRW